MELSAECKAVVDSVRMLVLRGKPDKFWVELHGKTRISPCRVEAVMMRWALGNECLDNDCETLLTLLSDALDIESEKLYSKCWDDLCGVTAWAKICEIGRIK